MQDVISISIFAGMMVLAFGYVRLCGRMVDDGQLPATDGDSPAVFADGES